MRILKPLAGGVAALSICLGASAALSKAHDQGVADGTRIDPSNLSGGTVAGVNVPGIGPSPDGFLGVAADLEQDLTYGQDNIVPRAQGDADPPRRVNPVDRPGQNKPPLAD